MVIIKLENWSITSRDLNNPYLAPELRTISLQGFAKSHPKLGSSRVITSPIKEVKGRLVITQSDYTYKLGKIDPNYRQWLKKNRPDWNWRNPIITKD